MGKITYKIILIIMCLTQINPAFAVGACVEDDVVPIIEHGWFSPTTVEEDSAKGGIFWQKSNTEFLLYGTSACLSSDHDVAQWGTYTNNNGILTDNGKVVVGGERNGKACWCKITYPIVSLWGMRDNSSWSSLNSCATNCAAYCLHRVMTNSLVNSVNN